MIEVPCRMFQRLASLRHPACNLRPFRSEVGRLLEARMGRSDQVTHANSDRHNKQGGRKGETNTDRNDRDKWQRSHQRCCPAAGQPAKASPPTGAATSSEFVRRHRHLVRRGAVRYYRSDCSSRSHSANWSACVRTPPFGAKSPFRKFKASCL